MAKKTKPKKSLWDYTKIVFKVISFGFSILAFLVFLLFFGAIISMFIPAEQLQMGNIAVIPIKGLITTGDDRVFGMSQAKSSDIIDSIKKAEEKNNIKAILLEIDSPGGSPVATDEITQAVKNAEKPVIAVIREVGASGAFWIATAADKVYANRMSLTGSIGVRGSSLGWSGLMKDYNVTYRRLVAGKYKDAGSPYKEMTPEEKELFQNILDQLYDEFVAAVAMNRNLTTEQVTEVADGFVILGKKAKELGLIDELGNKEDAVKDLEEELNITAELSEFKKKQTLQDLLFEMRGTGFEGLFSTGVRTSLT